MKKSGKVGLALLTALGLGSSCGRTSPPRPVVQQQGPAQPGTMGWGDDRPRDPCAPDSFSEVPCQQAVNSRGYYYGGSWYPMTYSYPYTHYYHSHQSYVSGGGTNRPAATERYSKSAGASRSGNPAGASSSSSSTSSGSAATAKPSSTSGSAATPVTRGGFGSTVTSSSGSSSSSSSSSSHSSSSSSSSSSHSSSSSSSGS